MLSIRSVYFLQTLLNLCSLILYNYRQDKYEGSTTETPLSTFFLALSCNVFCQVLEKERILNKKRKIMWTAPCAKLHFVYPTSTPFPYPSLILHNFLPLYIDKWEGKENRKPRGKLKATYLSTPVPPSPAAEQREKTGWVPIRLAIPKEFPFFPITHSVCPISSLSKPDIGPGSSSSLQSSSPCSLCLQTPQNPAQLHNFQLLPWSSQLHRGIFSWHLALWSILLMQGGPGRMRS